jgi:hypothetical protein
MFIDVVNAGWIPIYNLNLSDDVIGCTGAPAIWAGVTPPVQVRPCPIPDDQQGGAPPRIR